MVGTALELGGTLGERAEAGVVGGGEEVAGGAVVDVEIGDEVVGLGRAENGGDGGFAGDGVNEGAEGGFDIVEEVVELSAGGDDAMGFAALEVDADVGREEGDGEDDGGGFVPIDGGGEAGGEEALLGGGGQAFREGEADGFRDEGAGQGEGREGGGSLGDGVAGGGHEVFSEFEGRELVFDGVGGEHGDSGVGGKESEEFADGAIEGDVEGFEGIGEEALGVAVGLAVFKELPEDMGAIVGFVEAEDGEIVVVAAEKVGEEAGFAGEDVEVGLELLLIPREGLLELIEDEVGGRAEEGGDFGGKRSGEGGEGMAGVVFLVGGEIEELVAVEVGDGNGFDGFEDEGAALVLGEVGPEGGGGGIVDGLDGEVVSAGLKVAGAVVAMLSDRDTGKGGEHGADFVEIEGATDAGGLAGAKKVSEVGKLVFVDPALDKAEVGGVEDEEGEHGYSVSSSVVASLGTGVSGARLGRRLCQSVACS